MQGAPGRRNLLWMTSEFPLTFGGTNQERRQNDEAEIETFRQIVVNAGIAMYPVNPAGAGAKRVQPERLEPIPPHGRMSLMG